MGTRNVAGAAGEAASGFFVRVPHETSRRARTKIDTERRIGKQDIGYATKIGNSAGISPAPPGFRTTGFLHGSCTRCNVPTKTTHMDVKKATLSKGFKLSVMTLAIMNVTAVVSLRGLPAEAVYGLSSAFYYLFAAIVFLIPTALVAAELAAMPSLISGRVLPSTSSNPAAARPAPSAMTAATTPAALPRSAPLPWLPRASTSTSTTGSAPRPCSPLPCGT